MQKPSIPDNEYDRLNALLELQILDTPPEERFDHIIHVCKHLFNIPLVAISLVDNHRQWFKAYCGLKLNQTSRDVSFCGHAILEESVFIINNASNDIRFKDNPLVTGEPHIQFYAGAVIRSINQHKIGTLCIMDNKPRHFNTEEIALLEHLATWVEIELRSKALLNAYEKNNEYIERISKMNSFMIDRELMMSKLKEENQDLKKRLGIV